MSKERLEEIKELHEQANQAYHEKDFERMEHFLETLFTEEFTDWLIEQAERVQNLESRLAFEQGVTTNLQSKNKRYREALEEIKGATSHNKYWKYIAFKALEES